MKSKSLFSLMTLALALSSCTKEYVTNEYITNEYVTNEYVYNREYYSTVLSQQAEITERIRPAYLKAGDTVAICATSNYVTKEQIANGKSVLESWGLVVVEADNLYNQDGRYAGTVADRVEGLQKMIDNPNVKAIIAARGGYGCAQIMAMVDLKPMINNPKWVVGYSDVTVLLISLNNIGVETLHGPMAKDLSDKVSVENLKDALFGKLTEHSISTNDNCIKGKAEGRLVGGNLSMIYSLGGTLFDLNAKGAILFIEDTGESNYSLDRMLTNLKLSGKLDYVKGIVVGDFTNMNQGSDKSVEEIIKEKVGDLGIPVMYGLQAGHATRNLSLYMGRDVKLEVGDDKATLSFK
ncbi:MAG: LD-carboxypeptidase [Paludibacteraceae bacterium]|nr:LD-carboxypeptidase [Paludibacteraceae bacterium]